MTFNELINKLITKYGKENESIFYEMLSFLSRSYKTKSDIILSLRKEIDFQEKDIDKICNLYFKKKIPIEYITNKTFFMNMELFVNKNVLIPRKETEYLVSHIIDEYKNRKNIEVLDLCSGSGAIGLSIKKYLPESNVVLVDKYNKPIKISKLNAKMQNLDLKFVKSDLNKYFYDNNKYDLIISNPPYVDKKFKLDEYVKKEPKKALLAKGNGLNFIKIIIDNYYYLLKENGCLYIEFGFDQKEKIRQYVSNKYKYKFISDQFNIERFIKIIKE